MEYSSNKKIDSDTLQKIINTTTKVYRKGPQVETRKVGDVNVVELFGYEHTKDSPKEDNFQKVDMIFIDVVVDEQQAKKYENNLLKIIETYPDRQRFAQGLSYMELSPNFGLNQEEGLRLMALGKVLGLWDIMSGKSLGLDDNKAKEMAGSGFLYALPYQD